jgi:glycosyltransferase involved in cell wall biosynthesis
MAVIVAQRVFQVCAYVPASDVILLQKDLLFRTRIDLLERLLFRLAAMGGARVVFDVDDAIYLGTSVRPLSWARAKVHRIAARSSLVLAGSSPIVSEIRTVSSQVVHVPTCLVIGPRPQRSYRAAQGGPRLVWTGTATNLRYLQALAGPLSEFLSTAGGSILVVTRLADLPREFPGPALNVTLVEWSRDAEVQALGQADIGLAPLDDSEFARARCGGKLLAYFEAALPVVASPVGTQAVMVRHGQNGLVAGSPKEWVAGLMELSASSSLRERLGVAGRSYLEAHLSAERMYPQWRDWVVGAATLSPSSLAT